MPGARIPPNLTRLRNFCAWGRTNVFEAVWHSRARLRFGSPVLVLLSASVVGLLSSYFLLVSGYQPPAQVQNALLSIRSVDVSTSNASETSIAVGQKSISASVTVSFELN